MQQIMLEQWCSTQPLVTNGSLRLLVHGTYLHMPRFVTMCPGGFMLASWPRFLTWGILFAALSAGLPLSLPGGEAILSASFLTLACLSIPKVVRARTVLYSRLELPRVAKRKIPRHLRL